MRNSLSLIALFAVSGTVLALPTVQIPLQASQRAKADNVCVLVRVDHSVEFPNTVHADFSVTALAKDVSIKKFWHKSQMYSGGDRLGFEMKCVPVDWVKGLKLDNLVFSVDKIDDHSIPGCKLSLNGRAIQPELYNFVLSKISDGYVCRMA